MSGAVFTIMLIIFIVVLYLENVATKSKTDVVVYDILAFLIIIAGFFTGIQKGRPSFAVAALVLPPVGILYVLAAQDRSDAYKGKILPAKEVWWWALFVAFVAFIGARETGNYALLLIIYGHTIATCAWWYSESKRKVRSWPLGIDVAIGYFLFGLGSLSSASVLAMDVAQLHGFGNEVFSVSLVHLATVIVVGTGLVAGASLFVFERREAQVQEHVEEGNSEVAREAEEQARREARRAETQPQVGLNVQEVRELMDRLQRESDQKLRRIVADVNGSWWRPEAQEAARQLLAKRSMSK